MNNPLRDWRLVAALGAAALGTIGYNVVRPLLAGGASALTEENIVTPDTPAASDYTASLDGTTDSHMARVRPTAVDQFPDFAAERSVGRDPFAVIDRPASALATTAVTDAEGMHSENSPGVAIDTSPKVTAIVVTEHWRAAILAGRLVGPGATVAGLTVDRIEPDGVLLRGATPSPTFLALNGVNKP
jgi:hypothetical protein